MIMPRFKRPSSPSLAGPVIANIVRIASEAYSKYFETPEYFSPSQLYNMEQRNTQAEEDTQEYEESGDADYIDEEEETSEDY